VVQDWSPLESGDDSEDDFDFSGSPSERDIVTVETTFQILSNDLIFMSWHECGDALHEVAANKWLYITRSPSADMARLARNHPPDTVGADMCLSALIDFLSSSLTHVGDPGFRGDTSTFSLLVAHGCGHLFACLSGRHYCEELATRVHCQ
jgi:hypothetical protein